MSKQMIRGNKWECSESTAAIWHFFIITLYFWSGANAVDLTLEMQFNNDMILPVLIRNKSTDSKWPLDDGSLWGQHT